MQSNTRHRRLVALATIVGALLALWLMLLPLRPAAAQEETATATPAPQEEGAPAEGAPENGGEDAAESAEPPLTFPPDNWSAPGKLSRSGAVAAVRIFRDNDGLLHAIWRDTAIERELGYAVSADDGFSWSEPLETNWPFNRTLPSFAIDANDIVHALWIEPTGELYYSQVRIADFANPTLWSFKRRLAESALTFSTVLDDDGGIHLTYVRSLSSSTFPSGVYYRQSLNGGFGWTESQLIFESLYFRSAAREDVNVAIDTTTLVETGLVAATIVVDNQSVVTTTQVITETEVVLIGWDNRPQDEILLRRSEDNGTNWGDTQVVDDRQPEDALDALGPSAFQVAASGNDVHIFWRAGHLDLACSLYHQWSPDAGRSWNTREIVYGDAPECPTVRQIETNSDGSLWLLSRAARDFYLQRWEADSGWSPPQQQEAITRFINPETFRLVELGCQTLVQADPGNFVAVTCNENVGDVWVFRRQFDPFLFYPIPVDEIWSVPVPVTEQLPEAARFADPQMVADADGIVHAFWIEAEDTALSAESTLLYARWDGVAWSEPLPILGNVTRDRAVSVSAAADNAGRVYLAWATRAGRIQTSVAEAPLIATDAGWSEPVDVPAPGAAAAPDMVWRNGRLFLTYVVPVNEERGVYVVQSPEGLRWLPPVSVFDAVAAEVAAVGRPRLAVTPDNTVHIIWQDFAIAGQARNLLYSASPDGGENWLDAVDISENQVFWGEVVTTGSTLHVLWQERNLDGVTLWHQESADNGVTWGRANRIGSPAAAVRPVAVTRANQGALLLLKTTVNADGLAQLQQWEFDDGFWLDSQTINVSGDAAVQPVAVAALVAPDNAFLALYVTDVFGGPIPRLTQTLYHTSRVLPLVARSEGDTSAVTTSPVSPAATPEPPVAGGDVVSETVADSAESGPQPTPIPTLTFNTQVEETASTSRTSTAITGLLIGGGVTTVIAFIVVTALVRRRR